MPAGRQAARAARDQFWRAQRMAARFRGPSIGRPLPSDLVTLREELRPTHAAYVSTVSTAEMAVSLETAAYLLWLCRTREPASIADLGSGYSSFVLRQHADHKGVRVVSADGDQRWLEKSRRFIREQGLGDSDMVHWADLAGGKFDLVSHDLGSQEFRSQTAMQAFDLLASGGVMVIDDVHNVELWGRGRRAAVSHGRRWASLYRETLDHFGRFAALAY